VCLCFSECVCFSACVWRGRGEGSPNRECVLAVVIRVDPSHLHNLVLQILALGVVQHVLYMYLPVKSVLVVRILYTETKIVITHIRPRGQV